MGVETIADPCGGDCCTEGCTDCQCVPFVKPTSVKITIATLHEIYDYDTLPATYYYETFSSVFSPVALDVSGDPCAIHITFLSPITNTLGTALGTTAKLAINSPGFGLCNINDIILHAFPFSFEYTVSYTYRAGAPKSEVANGATVASIATSCNPDGTWVITFTNGGGRDYSPIGGGFDNYVSTFTNTITIEPL